MKCGAEKPLSAFYRHPKMKDGTVNKCKGCNKKENRTNREKNRDYYLEYDRERSKLPHRLEAAKEYAKTSRGKEVRKKSNENYKNTHPIKRKAHHAVNNAIRDGKLVKGSCEVCGCEKVHGHYDDYSKPLEVRWLCPEHHAEWHKINGEGLNPR